MGGVLRNAEGRVLCLFSSSLGILDAIAAEVYAIHKACSLIASKVSLVSRNIFVVSDCNSAVSWANGEGFGNFELALLIYDIRVFLQKF